MSTKTKKRVDTAALLDDGRRLKREIDAAYTELYAMLKKLGSHKRGIKAQEVALASIQHRLLDGENMSSPSENERIYRKRLIQATDDDGLP
jgi:hypothetical protein